MVTTEKEFKELCEGFVRVLEDGMKASEECSKAFEKTYGVLAQEIKFECAEKLIYYADKFSNATFLVTRWYWLRKMKKFVKGIDVLKEL